MSWKQGTLFGIIFLLVSAVCVLFSLYGVAIYDKKTKENLQAGKSTAKSNAADSTSLFDEVETVTIHQQNSTESMGNKTRKLHSYKVLVQCTVVLRSRGLAAARIQLPRRAYDKQFS